MIKKPQLYLVAALLFLIIIFFSVLIFSGRENTTEEAPAIIPVFSSPSSSPFKSLEIKPILTDEVPSLPEAEGGGVDLNSSIVQRSQTEVSKILPFLPYETKLQTPTGNFISILIPNPQFQTTPWILSVYIFDVDYRVNKEDADYNIQRDSFMAAVSNVFEWMKTNGIDPEKVIIDWGDRAYIREKAEKWISE